MKEIGRASCRERVENREEGVSSRRRHTRCLSDWSSDVCSSDLHADAHAWPRRAIDQVEADLLVVPQDEGRAEEYEPKPRRHRELGRPPHREIEEIPEDDLDDEGDRKSVV